MFIRFSKGRFDKNTIYSKCVLIGDSAIMEFGNKIVGIAKLHESTEKYNDYDVIIATNAIIKKERIERCIKDFIGKSYKFADIVDNRRRKYYVEEIDSDSIPVDAKIVFSRI